MANAITKNLSKVVVAVVVLAVVVGGVYYVFFRSDNTKTVTARFASAVGLYVGTPVKILGVNVGEITSVKPSGNVVVVKMTYDDKYDLDGSTDKNGNLDKVQAIQVANSLVSDRYIELGPLVTPDQVKHGAKVLKNDALIPPGQQPAELDDIYAALSKVSAALGPKGVNAGGQKNGALSDLLNVAAANLKGNGKALGDSVHNLAAAAQTLADKRGDLFQTIGYLRKFTDTLNQSDSQIRLFNTQLAQVAGDLADERSDLGAALKELGVALDSVNGFIKNNASRIHTSVLGLKDITNVLVKQKGSLEETLAVAPVALANITHAYQPDLGVIATRSNLASLTDPTQLCQLIGVVQGVLPSTIGKITLGSAQLAQIGQTLTGALGNVLGPLQTACLSAIKSGTVGTGGLGTVLQGVTGLLGSIGIGGGGLIGGG